MKRDAKFRKAWSLLHDRCQICGRTEEMAIRECGGVPLQTHHIIRFKRSDEACNLLRACGTCHELIHDGVHRDADGKELPHLTLGQVIAIKAALDESNMARLQELYGQALPEPEMPPTWCLPVAIDQAKKEWLALGKEVEITKRCPRCVRVGSSGKGCNRCKGMQ